MQRVHQACDFVKVNRFAGMAEATAKHEFTKNINRYKVLFPGEFSFYPTSFVLPDDLPRLKALAAEEEAAAAASDGGSPKRQQQQYYITKPSYGCGGEGIQLSSSIKDVVANFETIAKKNPLVSPPKFVTQEYIRDVSMHWLSQAQNVGF
jgi:Tubulin-tyrosine ligase family